MTGYFTHNWSGRTCADEIELGGTLDTLESNLFRRRGVEEGDFVYVVNVDAGQMRVLGRMQVDRIVELEQTEAERGRWPRVAKNQLLPKAGTATPIFRSLRVPWAILKEIWFNGPHGSRRPCFDPNDMTRLYGQALRGVQELTPDSAAMLDKLIDAEIGKLRRASSGPKRRESR